MNDRVHLVGVGGSGMSGLVRILRDRGDQVTGCDLRPARVPGIDILAGHDPSHVATPLDRVVYSPAVPEGSAELKEARRRGIEVLSYPQMVGRLMAEHRGIAVAGTHGKTTTTAMVSFLLARAGLDPSFVCGSVIPQLGGSSGSGKGSFFIAEACEYFRSFLHLAPKCVVLTNVEEDHLDYYKDLADITSAFREFSGKVGEDGVVIGSQDSPPAAEIVREFRGRGESFSLTEKADWRARNITVVEGRWTFEILKYGKPFGEVSLGVPGRHNVSNALAAAAVASWVGVGQEIIRLALEEFRGAERRLQRVGELRGALVFDDYAHHPTEIQVTLRALRELHPALKIWCVFQPHQYSRTRQFLKDFARSFADADLVLLTDIYAARDRAEDRASVSSERLAKLVDETGKAALYFPSQEELLSFLRDKVESDCAIITMGAGDIGEVARRLTGAEG